MYKLLMIFICFTIFLTFSSFSQKKSSQKDNKDKKDYNSSEWITYYEKSNYLETPNYKSTIDYIKKLEKNSNWIKYIPFGKSPEGRDLPMVIVSSDNSFTADEQKKSRKALVMIQCGIHAGEIDGKDAMLMLMRDIAISKSLEEIIQHVNLMIIPIFNVDGHERISPYNRINQNGPKEMGWRVTANRLNLNRDYLKADAVEMKYWLSLFNNWIPDFFIDCHVTDGSDFPYNLTYEVETNENINKGIAEWTKKELMPSVLKEMEKNGNPIVPYVGFKDEFDISKGISCGVMSPRLSTGYTAVQNRQGFLIETHSYKDYKTRVQATYQMVKVLIEYINKNYKKVKELVKAADKETENAYTIGTPIPLGFEMTEQSSGLDFKAYKVIKEKSEISGGYKRSYSKEIEELKIPFYNVARVSNVIRPPFAYIIPSYCQDVISILRLHGIKIGTMIEDMTLPVEMYKLSNPKWNPRPYEGRHTVEYKIDKSQEKIKYPKGTYVVPADQRASKVLMYLLEPSSKESLITWGFFDAIFEQKEYGEDYVLEKLAEDMLKDNDKLREEFDNKIKSDTSFAKNSFEKLNFFYKKSKYWDPGLGVYPITRLLEKKNFN
jgi:hypothetical protein